MMPFGLTNAQAVFQKLINDVLRDLLDCFVVVYLDDIIIHSQSLGKHTSHVRQVLSHLLANKFLCRLKIATFMFDLQGSSALSRVHQFLPSIYPGLQ